MLLKRCVISKNASNKSCYGFNLAQKVSRGICLPLPKGEPWAPKIAIFEI